jgi:hypothetical protein
MIRSEGPMIENLTPLGAAAAFAYDLDDSQRPATVSSDLSNLLARPSASTRTPTLPSVIEQHAQEAVALRHRRTHVGSASGTKLAHLGDLDARLEAHLDGLSIAGEPAWAYCEAQLEQLSRGSVFTAAVRAIEEGRQDRLARLIAVAALDPNAGRGLVSALG